VSAGSVSSVDTSEAAIRGRLTTRPGSNEYVVASKSSTNVSVEARLRSTHERSRGLDVSAIGAAREQKSGNPWCRTFAYMPCGVVSESKSRATLGVAPLPTCPAGSSQSSQKSLNRVGDISV
jgi:hypothetical protein